MPAEKSPERASLTIAQMYALADAIAQRYRAFVLLATFGSLRWGERLRSDVPTSTWRRAPSTSAANAPRRSLAGRLRPPKASQEFGSQAAAPDSQVSFAEQEADERGGVGLGSRAVEADLLGQGVAGQIPTVEGSVRVVHDHRVVGGVDHGRIDAPLIPCSGGFAGFVHGRQDGLDGLHDSDAGVGVLLTGPGVEHSHLVVPVSVRPHAEVVVVFGHQQVARGSVVAGHRASGHDGGGVVPAKGSRNLGPGQGSVVVQP